MRVTACLETVLLVGACAVGSAQNPPDVRTNDGQVASSQAEDIVVFITNKPAIFRLVTAPPLESQATGTPHTHVNQTNFFDSFLPGSLNNLVWTNLIAHTNGRTTQIWTERGHPIGWPAKAPLVKWNTNCLMWGMKGMTAISPCWEVEGASGQVPVTALTRRHGYTRGHGLGDEGFTTNFMGKKVWFVAPDDTVVETTVTLGVVRTRGGSTKQDYTLLLFKKDLPASIQPMPVAAATNVMAKYPNRAGAPWPLFKTEQAGNVSADIPGLTVATWKGGDSGSPDMLPLPGELVFFEGRSTSGPSEQMQADMDQLCRMEGLDPKRYQLQWADLSKY